MIAVAVAASFFAASACPVTNAKADLLSLHETTRQAHLRGDAKLIAATIGDQLLMAEDGVLRRRSNAEVEQFFTGYLKRVRYHEWRDVSPPVVVVSPDGEMGWMAVEVQARYTRADKPTEAEKTFKSSWIATYQRDKCVWRMTGMASDIAQ
jgi:hypothetical protein